MTTTIQRPVHETAREIRDDATRREFVLGGLSLGAIILTGCGDDDGDSAGTTPRSDAFPVTIAHKHGSTTISAEPKRVVTVGYNEQDLVLALGVRPLGVREWLSKEPKGIWPWAREAAGDARPVVHSDDTTLNFERIAALRPDVIIATYAGTTKADYRKLAQIAPVVEQSADYVDYGMPWQEQMRTIGRALGRSDKAAQVVADIRARIASERKKHDAFDGSTVVLAGGVAGGNFGVFGAQDPKVRLLTELGFTSPAAIDRAAGKEYYGEISRERLRLIDEDVLVFVGDPELRDDPLFRRLDSCARTGSSTSKRTIRPTRR